MQPMRSGIAKAGDRHNVTLGGRPDLQGCEPSSRLDHAVTLQQIQTTRVCGLITVDCIVDCVGTLRPMEDHTGMRSPTSTTRMNPSITRMNPIGDQRRACSRVTTLGEVGGRWYK